MATDAPGTTFNTVGAGVAVVGNKYSGMHIIVRPYAGPAAYAPIVNSGEVGIAVMSASSAYQAFSGHNEQKTAYRNLRLLRAGSASLMLGFLVRKDGPIKTFADLKGKRVSSDFGGHLAIADSLTASLKIAGYGWKDVVAVPVSGANDGIEALVANRLDATWASLGQPQAREADTQIGVRYLSVPDSPQALSIYREAAFPGARIGVVKKDAAPGIDGQTRLLSYDSYIVANKDVPDAVITKLLEGLWKGTGELVKVHPSMRGYTQDSAVTDAPVIPYHPAAIAFYKKEGLWNAEAQKRQDALMAEAAN
jgi:TRAP transporter TAXI family solute receptor